MLARVHTVGSAPSTTPAGRRVPRLAVVLAAVAALVVAGLAARAPAGPQLSLAGGGDGDLSILNSEKGRSLMTLGNIAPGDTARGTVTLENTGSVPGDLSLSGADLVDLPGAGGGRLSERLRLSIVSLPTRPGAPRTVYEGPLGGVGRVGLGELAPGRRRIFEFTVIFPDGGVPPSAMTGDNAYQGAQASVDYAWHATADAEPEDEGGGSGGRGGSGESAAEPPAASAPGRPPTPSLRILLPRTFSARGQTVAMSCPGCARLDVRGSVRLPGGRRVRTRPVTAAPGSGGSARVRVAFSRVTQRVIQRRLRRGERLMLVLRATGTSPTGQVVSSARRGTRVRP